MAKYIDDRLFTKELIISKGKGKLTKDAENMIIKLAYRLFERNNRHVSYRNNIYYDDICSGGLEAAFKNWRLFNHKKYDSAFNYLTEIIKRGQTKTFNDYICNKDSRGNAHFYTYYDFFNTKE